jgi:hypothetical protein
MTAVGRYRAGELGWQLRPETGGDRLGWSYVYILRAGGSCGDSLCVPPLHCLEENEDDYSQGEEAENFPVLLPSHSSICMDHVAVIYSSFLKFGGIIQGCQLNSFNFIFLETPLL